MSFQSLVARLNARPETDTFRIGIEPKLVVFKPPLDVLNKLGWAAGTKLDIQLGEGEDAGKVRLTRDPKGWSLLQAGGSANGLTVKCHRQFVAGTPEGKRPAVSVRHELDGDTAIIAWLPWIEAAAADTMGFAALSDSIKRIVRRESEGPVAAEQPPEDHETIPVLCAEPARILDNPSDSSNAFAAADEQSDAIGRTVGSIPATGASMFPVQQRSLAEAEAPRAPEEPRPLRSAFAPPEPGAYGYMSAEQTEEFVQACARDALWGDLGNIIAKKPGDYARGSIKHLRDKLAGRITAAREALKPTAVAPMPTASVPPPFKAGPLPPAPKSLPDRMVPRYAPVEEAPAPKPALSPELLKFLREEVAPVLLPLNIKITKNHDDTGLERNGLPVTLAAVIAEVNRILARDGDGPITFDTAA